MQAIFLVTATLFLMSCGNTQETKQEQTAPVQQQQQSDDNTDTDYTDEEQSGPDFGPGLG